MPPDRLAFIVPLFRPVVLAFAVVCAAVGLVGLTQPDLMRTFLRASKSPLVRGLMGTAIVAVGLVMILRPSRPYAPLLELPALTLLLGVLLAVKGSLWVIAPGPTRWVLDFHIARNDWWERTLGLVSLVFAVIFFLVSRSTSIGPF